MQYPLRNPTESEGPCEWHLTFEMPKQNYTHRYVAGYVDPHSNGRVMGNPHVVQTYVGQEQDITHCYSPKESAGEVLLCQLVF